MAKANENAEAAQAKRAEKQDSLSPAVKNRVFDALAAHVATIDGEDAQRNFLYSIGVDGEKDVPLLLRKASESNEEDAAEEPATPANPEVVA